MMLFLSGVLAMGYAVAALCFLRFWRRTRDRLFALFAAAFAVLAVHRCLLAASTTTDQDFSFSYLLRLGAFLLILYAIIDKNRGVRGDRV